VTSRQRILAAFRQEAVDHLPCAIYFNDTMRVHGYDPRTPESIAAFHESLGVDPVLDIPPIRAPLHPSVCTRTWIEQPSSVDGEVLYKEYATPAGRLRVGVRLTPEWPFGGDIPFPGDDFCASHLVEPLVKEPDDVEAFAFLLRPPGGFELDRARARIREVTSVAAAHGVAVRVTAGQGLATLLFQMGAERLVLFAVDHPEAFERLARIESDATVAAIPLYAEIGVDILKRFGGYEQTNFFSPAIWKAVVGPALGREIEAAHSARLPIYYRVVTGMKPLLEDIGALGLDCVEGFEPVLSDCPNHEIQRRLGGKVCLWTGVSSPGHIGNPDPEVVRAAVRSAVETFGRRGFILGVTNSIRAHWKWENTLAMVEEWKKVR
jgi:hypothetical protein